MPFKLHIGNLSYKTTSDDLKERFTEFGAVVDAVVIEDRESRRSRGFGFVTYDAEEEANAAIEALNEQELDGRTIRVSHAAERREGERGDRGDRRGFRGGSRGGSRRPYDREDRGYGDRDRERGSYRDREDRGYDRNGDRGYEREDRHRNY